MGSSFSTQRYTVLPTTASNGSKSSFHIPPRYRRVLLVVVALLLWLAWQRRSEVPYPKIQLVPPKGHTLPPLFQDYRKYEDSLSERNYKANGGTQGKYISYANHAAGSGWGNVLQDMVFNALVAASAHRGFVWNDYTWDRDLRNDYSDFNGKIIPARVPVSTMLSGYMVGRPTDIHPPPTHPLENQPLAISRRIFEKVCPEEERYTIHRDHAKEHGLKTGMIKQLSDYDQLSGRKLLDVWISMLDSPGVKEARCLETSADTMPVFDIWFFGEPTRMVDIWDTIVQSPALTNWGWSKLMHQAFEKNIQFFTSQTDSPSAQVEVSRRDWVTWLSSKDHNPPTNDSAPLPILALHIRRGDFEGHCKHLATWSSNFNAINSLPVFADHDKFVAPRVNENAKSESTPNLEARFDDPLEVTSEEGKNEVYAKHCYPDIPQIVKRVREVVMDYQRIVGTSTSEVSPETGVALKKDDRRVPGGAAGNVRLRKVYIMTNGDRQWLGDVKKALMKDAAESGNSDAWEYFEWIWEDVSTSRDLDLGWEEKYVAQSLDMYVAQRAELFVGNGFSSLTSNIVMLRQKNGLNPLQTRFW